MPVLDSIAQVGVPNVKSHNRDTLPSPVPVRKIGHETTAEINSLLLDNSN